jgi:hypothetical protein
MVLEAIYEQDFLPCSYDFRPARSAHQALHALRSAIWGQQRHWVLDVDIRKYLESASDCPLVYDAYWKSVGCADTTLIHVPFSAPTVTGLPTPQRAGVDAGQGAGRDEPGAVRTGLFNVTHQVLAVFQAGHASSPWWKTAESFFDSTSKAAVSASALSLRCGSRSNSLTRRRSCRASRALAARGSPRPAIASRFQASSSAGYSPCSRHQALRVASSMAAATITACSRAAAVQRRLPAADPLAKASARQRPSVATLIPTSRDTKSVAELSGGNSLATIRSLVRLSVSSHFELSAPPKVPIPFRRQLV